VLIVNLVLSVSACANLTTSRCSHWDITGYYTPVEHEFIHKTPPADELQQITLSNSEQYAVNTRFLKEVKLEGWGRTRLGWYLGYYNRQWHKSSSPMDANGNALIKGMVAAKQGQLSYGTELKIASISDILNIDTFAVADTGMALRSKHIDVYTGEGNSAKLTSYKVTGKHRVCIL